MSEKRMSSLRLIWLEAFVAVARLGTYKAAAETLDVDPTVIARYVSKLEKWLRRELIKSSNNLPKLTDCGKKFVPISEKIISNLNMFRGDIIKYDLEMYQRLKNISDAGNFDPEKPQ